MSFFARVIYPNGGSGTYAVPFPYIDKSHIIVLDDGVPYVGTLTWPNPAAITLSPDIAFGHSVQIQRMTPEGTKLVTFAPGALSSNDLNLANTQLLYIDQEESDAGAGNASGVSSVNSRTGVVLLSAADVSIGFGTSVASALIAGTNISLNTVGGLTTINNTGGGGGSGAVNSVNGRTGTIVLAASDVSTGFGTAVAGSLAAGSGVSLSTSSGVTTINSTGAVASVNTRTGAVTLTAPDVASGFGTAVASNLQAGSNISLSTTAGVTTINAVIGGSVSTWNPADAGPHTTLSGGNLIVTNNNPSASNFFEGGRCTLSRTTGKFYFEYRSIASGAAGAIGLTNATMNLNTGGVTGRPGSGSSGDPLQGFGVFLNGSIQANGALPLAGGWFSAVNGAGTVQVAVDLTAKLLWIKLTSGSQWNNDGAADPATGTGGVPYTNTASEAFFVCYEYQNGAGTGAADGFSINFGASSFVGTVPSGFAGWATGSGSVGSVASVNGRNGAVVLSAADVATGFAAAAQAAFAPGAGIGFSTSGGVLTITNTAGGGGGAVSSVNSRTGAVALTAADVTSGFGTQVGSALAAGSNVTISTSGGVTTINSTASGSLPHDYFAAFESNIKVANSATTNTTNLNALIATVSALGGGEIRFLEAGDIPINNTITWLPKVSFKMISGCKFAWAGGSSGNIFTTRSTDVIIDLDMECFVDEGSSFSGVVFRLHSCQNCKFTFRAYGNNAASTFLHISADSTAGEWPGGGRNFVFNEIHAQHRLQCGTGLLVDGVASGFGGQPQAITLNTFYNFQCAVSAQYGIRMDSWFDTNTFAGNTYLAINGSGGVGVINNPASPTVFTAVYNIRWEQLSIDTFGSGLGRYGVVLNAGWGFTCSQFFQDPPAEVAPFTGTNATSYWFMGLAPGSTSIFLHTKNASGTGA